MPRRSPSSGQWPTIMGATSELCTPPPILVDNMVRRREKRYQDHPQPLNNESNFIRRSPFLLLLLLLLFTFFSPQSKLKIKKQIDFLSLPLPLSHAQPFSLSVTVSHSLSLSVSHCNHRNNGISALKTFTDNYALKYPSHKRNTFSRRASFTSSGAGLIKASFGVNLL